MRLSDNARRRRILLLSKRLDEFAAARRELLHQLVDLDAQAGAAQLEHNSLCNLDAPISHVPDEVLAMIFEEGMHPLKDADAYNFGVLASHVTQRWRNVSISTPKLWNNICCLVAPDDDRPPYPERLIGRAFAFLSRARSLPLSIHIEEFRNKDLSSNFLQLIGDHVERCFQLRILDSDHDSLMELLEVISPRPMPLLASIDLRCCDKYIEFEQQLLPSGVPRLTTASIDGADTSTLHLTIPAFQCLTSLQLSGLYITITNRGNDQRYQSLRDALMALPSLRHLDLSMTKFIALSSRLPILLPTIHYLHVEGFSEAAPFCIQAPYLIALSLCAWNANKPSQVSAHPYEHHFPSLQHLILMNIANDAPHLMTFSRAFPYIERLTFKPGSHPSTLLQDINRILGIVSAHDGLLWPELHSIALSTPREHLDVPRLKSTILKLQAAGHPIRKLVLPQEVHPAMAEMGGTVELEDFYVDWPTPFDW